MKKLLDKEKGLSVSLKATIEDNKAKVDSDVQVQEATIIEVISLLLAMNEAIISGLEVDFIKPAVMKTLGNALIEMANGNFKEDKKLLS
jgi:hypothetical protein|nr:MAG TPA: hypothetical protein [Caudoviricetes sp.]